MAIYRGPGPSNPAVPVSSDASRVEIVDSGEYYTSDNVEGALDEIGNQLGLGGGGSVITSGTIDGVSIGATTPATYLAVDQFTFDSRTMTLGGADILVDIAGTTTLSNIDALDATTIATMEAAMELNIDTLDGVSIGATTPATYLAVTGNTDLIGDLDVDNLNLNGNTIISTDVNGDINLTPNGTGQVVISKADINAGTFDGVVGGTTPAAGTFTTFTSTGIDDNATGERLQLANTLMTLGTSGAGFSVEAADDAQFLVLGGAGADIVLYGGTHATLAGDFNFRTIGNASQLYYDDSASSWNFQANAITTTGSLTCGTFTSTGIDDNTTGERLQLSNTAITYGVAGAGYTIQHAANDQSVFISGGNAFNAGANIKLTGGTTAGSAYDILFRSDAVTELLFDYDANVWDFQANAITTTGTITGNIFASDNANPSTAGIVRLGNAEGVYWRNATNTNNMGFRVTGNDEFVFAFNGTDEIEISASLADYKDTSITTTGTISGGSTITLGASDTTAGAAYLYGAGAGSDIGGGILLYTAADHDTTYNYFNLTINQDDFRIGTSANATAGAVWSPASSTWNYGANAITTTGSLLVGLGSALTTTLTPQAQFSANGNNSGIGISYFASAAGGGSLSFLKSRNATEGSYTIVADDDLLGAIRWFGDDGVDYASRAAAIEAFVDGTPGAGDMPTRLEFSTTADGAEIETTRFQINANGTLVTGAATALGGEAGSLTVSTGDSGASSVQSDADDLVIENNASVGSTWLSATTGSINLFMGDSTSQTLGRIIYGASSHASLANTMSFYTAGTEAMRIDANQDVGIGATTVDARLHVQDTAGLIAKFENAAATVGYIQLFSQAGQNANIQFGDDTNGAFWTMGYNYNSGTDDFTLYNVQTTNTAMRISGANDDVRIGVGNLVIGTSGQGIDFSAVSDGARSVDSNLLDDYEEGTWTPVLSDTTSTVSKSQTYTSNTGEYTKIGNMVYFWGRIQMSSIGTLSGNAYIHGLPFTSGSDFTRSGIVGTQMANLNGSNAGMVTAQIERITTYMFLRIWDVAGGTSAVTCAEYSNDGNLHFQGSYHI